MYGNQNILQKRAPDTIFVLFSLKDVYTINVFIVFFQFGIMMVFKLIFYLLRNKHKIFQSIYGIFAINTRWWTIIIGILEANISYVTFYGSIQFNEFISFNFFSKIDLLCSTFFVFIMLFYSFVFYPLIFKYERIKYN